MQCFDGMVENDCILIVWHLRVGSAGHGPANVGEVCGIHVSYPVNGGSRSSPRESSSDVSIRWGAPTLTPYINLSNGKPKGRKAPTVLLFFREDTYTVQRRYTNGGETICEGRCEWEREKNK